MADIKKFLDQTGVSTLWARIMEKFGEAQETIDDLVTIAGSNAHEIKEMKEQIEVLEKGTYDDTDVRNLINTNADAIAILNNGAESVGSVAHTATTIAAAKVAEIVANADASFDTLKEIAEWILNDTTGAANMANNIAALQAQMVGIDETVVAKIAAEITAALKVEGVDKYALASDLSALADRVKAIEDAGYQNAAQVGSAIDAKIAALKLAESYDAKGAAAQALVDAKSYTDAEVAKIQALTPEDIDAAIQAANSAN